ncbi:hypothetical protein PR002_g18227 [Phytophthora rubi]|uniref:Uncharacterized protein n=1 Tax=Phytophthora rubi TaxID=129364 RepID=A0A6A3K2H1_9STRA|nr:hypothetical protein PR002_g18227 [Phytophthora rubi]
MQGYGYSQYKAHSPHHQRTANFPSSNTSTWTTAPMAAASKARRA